MPFSNHLLLWSDVFLSETGYTKEKKSRTGIFWIIKSGITYQMEADGWRGQSSKKDLCCQLKRKQEQVTTFSSKLQTFKIDNYGQFWFDVAYYLKDSCKMDLKQAVIIKQCFSSWITKWTMNWVKSSFFADILLESHQTLEKWMQIDEHGTITASKYSNKTLKNNKRGHYEIHLFTHMYMWNSRLYTFSSWSCGRLPISKDKSRKTFPGSHISPPHLVLNTLW